MIHITDKRNCVGCANCLHTCPVQCISFVSDKEGFSYPLAEESKCIGCNRCDEVCPVSTSVLLSEESVPNAYGAYLKNDELRMQSSSGGIFSALAIEVINHQGVVYGATLMADNSVKHISIKNRSELPLLQKSKYVQSDIRGVFPRILHDLIEKKQVLFSGTPCQVKALYTFFGNRPQNLLTVEVVCHGVPSPLIFRQYMQENKASEMIFRKKERSWSDYDVEIRYKNGHLKTEKASKNLYMRGFLQNWFLRPSCSQCPAKSFMSGADITLGDFWGGQNYVPHLFDDKGTSVVFLHTMKGKIIWEKVMDNIEYCSIPIEVAIEGNPCISQSVNFPISRDKFFEDLGRMTLMRTLKKNVGEKKSLKQIFKGELLAVWNFAWNVVWGVRERYYRAKDKLYCLFYKAPCVKSIEESLKFILDKQCSVSRFGDGELKFILGDQTWFQDKNPILRQRLTEILRNRQDNLMVCVPNIFRELSIYSEHDSKYWLNHIVRMRKTWYQNMDLEKTYYDAFISRCYMPYANKTHVKYYFDLWKKVWEERDVLILEGEKTRLGVGNDLFANAKSIKRILCPNTQAFSYYDKLFHEVLKFDKIHLVLIALGPTATVLASDLSSYGYQAIDIGHIDIEYEWFLQHATHKVPVKNKFVNEAGAGKGVGDCDDKQYLKEIICHF